MNGALAAAILGASFALVTGAQAQTVINVTVASDPGTNSAGTTGGPGTLSAAMAGPGMTAERLAPSFASSTA